VYGAEPARRVFERTGPTPSAGSRFMRSKRDAMAKIHLEVVSWVLRVERQVVIMQKTREPCGQHNRRKRPRDIHSASVTFIQAEREY
jgi:hypothetical protein